MAKTKQTQVEIVKDKAPDRKCNITPIYMAQYINDYYPDDRAWFKQLCEGNEKADNPYGFDVKTVREAFIEKYFPENYKKKEPISRKDEFKDLIKGW